MFRKDFLMSSGTLLAGYLTRAGSSLPDSGMKTIRPPRLKRGDTIGFIAPAGIVYDENEFLRMQQVMEEMGFRVVFGRHVRRRYGYLSGTDEERASDLNAFFSDPEIDGILAVRGGWGCNRILPLVDYEAIRKNPKFFCGFSDITSLHMAIHTMSGVTTFHGPNGTSEWTPLTRNYFREMAFSGGEGVNLINPLHETDAVYTINSGSATGRLFGGNLTLISSLVGTGYLPDMEGGILFLEDIGEQFYKIDRMLSQLRLCGILENLNGFIFGRCTNCFAGIQRSLTMNQVLDDYLKPLGIPAFYGSMISHEPDSFTIPVGIKAEMNSQTGSIRILESALS